MIKRSILGLIVILFLACSGAVHAGAVKDGVDSAGQAVGKGLEPVGEDVDFFGRSLFFGIGAVVAAPFRFVQDVINAVSQGMAHEKLWDHTN